MHLSRRGRRLLTWIPLSALVLAATATAPIMAHRFGPDHTLTRAPAAARSITILAAGDILVHPPTWQQAQRDAAPGEGYNFRPLLADVRPVITDADLALCHMEAPMGPGDPKDFPRFNAPPPLAHDVKWTGFDGCSTASNHSLDQGPQGVTANLTALDGAGLAHTGTARSVAEAGQARIYTVHGVKVGHLSYAYGLNAGTSLPADKPWMANLFNLTAILIQAHLLKQQGAAIVVLSAHWGIERQHQPNPMQINGAAALLASPDIDLIVGHHAHVVQPMEKINGKWVAYGVGNLLARHDFPIPDNKEGFLPRITFTETAAGTWTATRAEAIPIWLSLEPEISVVNLPATMTRMSDADRRRTKYEAAFHRISKYLNERGAVNAGLQILGPAG